MDTRAIAFAIPFFFLLIGIELWLDGRRRRRSARQPGRRADAASRPPLEPAYRFADAISSLSCGVGQQVLAITVVSLLALAGYTWVYEHVSIFSVRMDSVPSWIAIVLLVDLAYYAYHRASHRINFFWASHAVHHQSEEYNLATALRQSWFTGLTSWIFYLPMAVLGFPPLMFVIALTANTLYQFWIHTRLVGKLGFWEKIFNTPSHHRVHHGIDPEYIDKNYAGIFIIWDRLFGTFIEETGEPAYGTVKPLASFNPFWANIEPFVALAKMSMATRRLSDKVRVWLAPPEWRPADLGGVVVVPPVSHATRVKHAGFETPAIRRYVVFQFAVTAVVVGALLFFNASLDAEVRLSGVAVTLLSLLVWGGLFERRPWTVPVELARLVLQIGYAALVLWRLAPKSFFAVGLALASLLALLSGMLLWSAAASPRADDERASA